MEIYITSEGDSYAAIAQSFGVDEGYLRSVNGAAAGEPALGQAVVILRPERTVTVGEGDTLYGIASANGMTLPAIYRLNPALGGRGEVYPGQVIVLSVQGERRGSIETNGYAYTNIDEALLRTVMSDFDLKILETCPVEYRCYCSRERVERALISLGRTELEQMLSEQGGCQLTCQFCDAVYEFTAEDIQRLLKNL